MLKAHKPVNFENLLDGCISKIKQYIQSRGEFDKEGNFHLNTVSTLFRNKDLTTYKAKSAQGVISALRQTSNAKELETVLSEPLGDVNSPLFRANFGSGLRNSVQKCLLSCEAIKSKHPELFVTVVEETPLKKKLDISLISKIEELRGTENNLSKSDFASFVSLENYTLPDHGSSTGEIDYDVIKKQRNEELFQKTMEIFPLILDLSFEQFLKPLLEAELDHKVRSAQYDLQYGYNGIGQLLLLKALEQNPELEQDLQKWFGEKKENGYFSRYPSYEVYKGMIDSRKDELDDYIRANEEHSGSSFLN